MRRRLMLTIIGPMLVLAACGGNGTTEDTGAVTVNLAALNDSGITGTATLTESDGQTTVVVTLDNAGAGPQPIHIHPGTCATLDPMPAYPLTNVTNGGSETTVDATIASLQSDSFAINAHKSPEEAQIYVACGDIT